MTTQPGYYPDPYDATIDRHWDGEKWALLIRTHPNADPVRRHAAHVGNTQPAPGTQTAARPVDNAAPNTSFDNRSPNATPDNRAPNGTPGRSSAALPLALLWAAVALVVGIMTITGAHDAAYGGDAYTGIQNTTAQSVRALGWLIIATGPLGLIIATSRR